MRKFNSFAIIVGTILVTLDSYSQILTGNGPTLSSPGGMNGPPTSSRDASAYQNIVNINGQNGFYFKKDLYLINYVTIIDGQRVLGIPFLFPEWLDGSLTTPDGRVYTDYKYKYNVENQTISFKLAKDSLEANEEIKEFILKVVNKDSIIQLRFVNSDQYQRKGPKTIYYEVLLDDTKGQLLKLNKKVVATVDNTIIASKTGKYLKADPTYFYYEKSTKKLTRIKSNSNMRSMLSIPEEYVNDMHIDTFDLEQENNIIRLFKLYFEKAKLKGF